MLTRSSPTVVFIDDRQDELRPLADRVREAGMAGCKVDSPADIDSNILASADLVIVDYTLDEWIDNVGVDQLSLKPVNGIALASVLREHCRTPPLKHAPPTGFALITGKPDTVSMAPGEQRSHVVARLSNLEWFFEKQANADRNVQRIVSLASAIHELPTEFSHSMVSLDRLLNLLGVSNDNELFERYRSAVGRCRPPIHHLSKDSGGIVLLRWLLHRILPHTCFLLDDFALAARLRVTPSSLRTELVQETEFAGHLRGIMYSGPLAQFDGTRWWRSGIEQWLWNVTGGKSANTEAIHDTLAKMGVTQIQPVMLVRPVVTLDASLQQEEQLSSRDNVVALHLDDWPSYAEPAYARNALVAEDNQLRLFVVDDAN